MKLRNPGAEIWVPDGAAVPEALARTTHMGIGAHQDDLEIFAYSAILDCYGRADRWFTGVVVTDGAGSARSGPYAAFTDEQMRQVRKQEQKKAGFVGDYGAVVLLDYPSQEAKEPPAAAVVGELVELVRQCRPEVLFTHNLADKHDTHVATALRVIEACRALPEGERPRRLLGGEVWRDLDWMNDQDKIALDVQARESLGMALLGVFDSQISGGKRYDLATAGRRRAHATYHESHGLDATTALTFAMDLTPLLTNVALDPQAYAKGFIDRFAGEVQGRLARLSGKA
jgi:LmbE family N-acetylglucosaminyl deacetylase